MSVRPFVGALLGALVVLGSTTVAPGAPKSNLWPHWEANDPQSATVVDHAAWGTFLQRNLQANHPTGVNRLHYGAVTPEDRWLLDEYVGDLASVRVSGLNRAEQKAFWINFYNALTVQVILEHYPVKSIRDIRLGGVFSSGPWDAKLVTVEGEKVSLNDIEHRILRPIWRDNRIHFAVNCASVGCPNLAAEPFAAANTEGLLDEAARTYVNHPRGATVENGRLTVSSIFDWYQADFGGSKEGVLSFLRKYAAPELAASLTSVTGSFRFRYDWSLNE